MTSSLVGSEMCIRDSTWSRNIFCQGPIHNPLKEEAPWAQAHAYDTPCAVSYTHLTLPTICSV
eukprot:2123198-Prorocentrum_lima.AAC.1